MTTLFSRIIVGELPGRFVWRDERCVAFLTINPLTPGHTLVVPRDEVDHWLDLDADLLHHLMDVAQQVGKAIADVWSPRKVGVVLAGLEVDHVHVHVTAINAVTDLDFAGADTDPAAADLDAAAEAIREALRARGAQQVAKD